ncbi:MAG: hypothetical protein KDB07_09885, partial [Planctomycetes bacterium]|nr:hypothetical protein [Planctomycetota bacterium]
MNFWVGALVLAGALQAQPAEKAQKGDRTLCKYEKWELFKFSKDDSSVKVAGRLDRSLASPRALGDCFVVIELPRQSEDKKSGQRAVLPLEFGGKLLLAEYDSRERVVETKSADYITIPHDAVPKLVAAPTLVGSVRSGIAVGVLVSGELGFSLRHLSRRS